MKRSTLPALSFLFAWSLGASPVYSQGRTPPTEGSDATSRPDGTQVGTTGTNTVGNPADPSRAESTGPDASARRAMSPESNVPRSDGPVYDTTGLHPANRENPNGLNALNGNISPNEPNSVAEVNSGFNPPPLISGPGYHNGWVASNGAVNPATPSAWTVSNRGTPAAPGEVVPAGFRPGFSNDNSINNGMSGLDAPLGTGGNNGLVGNPGSLGTPGVPVITSPSGSGR